MPAQPLTTKDGRDSIQAGDLYIWRADATSFWNEVEGWRSWPMNATVYAPTYPQGKPVPPTAPPHAGFRGDWVLFGDALRDAMRRDEDHAAARAGR